MFVWSVLSFKEGRDKCHPCLVRGSRNNMLPVSQQVIYLMCVSRYVVAQVRIVSFLGEETMYFAMSVSGASIRCFHQK